MDDTFWNGTLSEGSVTLVDLNIEIVKTLADRGIMSSISSKNDFEAVKQVLAAAGIWDYFIFPHISWNPKGGSIASIVEQANLRPENVLFIDDNPINIEEIRFRFPTMMAAYPWDVLPVLLELKQTAGKDDRTHSRLKQYKQLEKKVSDQSQTSLSNEDFLRQCDIKIRFEFDVDQHTDRIIELINRSNQLNFTKVRVETSEAVAEFRQNLQRHDVFSAGIFASDRYGNHGLVGFYMLRKTERVNKLLHYVWSCRMMNAGLEQYVYKRIGEPSIQVVGPVSNPIKTFDKIDWVKEMKAGEEDATATDAPRLLLIGSCDLTAVASYCSPNRAEYVNGVKNGIMTRYDDFGFILGDAAKIKSSKALEKIPSWDKADFESFHERLASSDVLIVSLSAAMKGAHLLTDDGAVVRVHPEGLGSYVDANPWADFLKGTKLYEATTRQRADLLKRSLEFLHASAGEAKHTFLLGANTRDVSGALSRENYKLLTLYNEVCAAFCEANADWHFVSINDVVAYDKLTDDRHYTRIGYFDIASYINEKIHSGEKVAQQQKPLEPVGANLVDMIRSGRMVSRLHLFGTKKGALSHVKRVIKLTPLSGVFRRTFFKPKKNPLVAWGKASSR
jgi:FkbH-like protein